MLSKKEKLLHRLIGECSKCFYFEPFPSSSMGLCAHIDIDGHREKTHYCDYFKPQAHQLAEEYKSINLSIIDFLSEEQKGNT